MKTNDINETFGIGSSNSKSEQFIKKQTKINDKFPVLKSVATVLKLFGYITLIIGLGYFILYESIIEPNSPNHGFGSEDILQLTLGLGLVFISLIGIAFSELIYVFPIPS